MSLEEEVELRDLVAQTLEGNGVLPKIRAQLRANLFLALNEDSKISKQQPLLNKKIKSQLAAPEGQLMFCLVREFLEYFNLDFTISVYEPESYSSCYKYEGREKIIEELGLNEDNLAGPILLHLIKIAQTKSKTLKINLTNLNGERAQNGSSSLSSIPDEVNGSGVEDESDNGKQIVGEEQLLNALQTSNPSNKVDDKESKDKSQLDSTYTKKEIENDDTFNGTSSIEEESVHGADVNINQKFSTNEEESVSSTDQEWSPESKSKLEDKTKSSQKSDKIKSKLELSPLQLNKSRGSDILPSLYTKDFKDKNKDFDFDIKDDYEEDFMSGSEVEFSLSKVDCPKLLLDELQHSSEKTNKCSMTNNKNSKSDNKLVNSSTTASDDIETNLSVGETDVSSRTQIKS